MRLVRDIADLPEALRSAQAEARAAFGDGRLLLERALLHPRHVEVQVLADRHGRVLHLGERDCSVQRRHQKLIEEAPSPAVDAGMRRRLGDAAVQVARAAGYVGAGTVEFLLDADGSHYFMEMNTRLQVEHPVTECLTGLDLVAWQLRVAAGAALDLTQEDVLARFESGGHAIEARLCAEDPAQEHLPQAGRLVHLRAPPVLRCDAALASGMEVSPHYDSLLAKLIAHGANRAEAIARLAAGLDATQCLGLPTNRAFLARVLRHPEFAAARVDTGFLSRHFSTPDARAPRTCSPTCARRSLRRVAATARSAAAALPAVWSGWQSGAFAVDVPVEIDGAPKPGASGQRPRVVDRRHGALPLAASRRRPHPRRRSHPLDAQTCARPAQLAAGGGIDLAFVDLRLQPAALRQALARRANAAASSTWKGRARRQPAHCSWSSRR
jgi:geranyl-CoA carboxylase alpha subunit